MLAATPIRFNLILIALLAASGHASSSDPARDLDWPTRFGRRPVADANAAEGRPVEPTLDVTVRGKRRPAPRGVSDFSIGPELLALAPHADAGDLLRTAPGVTVSRPEGDAVAHEVFLRGFDAEHGQDVALSMDGVPMNEVSHIHGQGYADLSVIIPETVQGLRVTEGVYDPRQGDFAVAGSIDFQLGVPERGLTSRTEYGSFDTVRQLLLWAPEGEHDETFGAAQLKQSAGFGQNRGSLLGGAVAQWGFETEGGTLGVIHFSGVGARAGIAGVLRVDDIDRGLVDFYGGYDTPAATAQSALSSRFVLSSRIETPYPSGARAGGSVWLQRTAFRIRANYTGFVERSETQPNWIGRGDLIEQENADLAFGGSAFYRSRRFAPARHFSGNVEAGLSLRTDVVDQAQNLLQAPQNETWDKRVDATLRTYDVGFYADTDWKLGRLVTLRGGVRADVLVMDINDRLGHFLSSFNLQSHIIGFRRTATGVAWGPRVSLDVTPLRSFDVSLAYGEGYRSPQARQLDEGESAPYAKVRSLDAGIRYAPLHDDRLTLAVSGYATFLSADLAFDPGEGSLEHIGPTTRAGITTYIAWRFRPWAIGALSLTWVHATLDAPPPATADDPSPPFEEGELLPYVPPLVFRLDAASEGPLANFGGGCLEGRVGLGLSVIGPRPLPYGQRGDVVTTLDLSARLRWRWIELGFSVTNVADARQPAAEYSFVSDWGSREVPSLVPTGHLSAAPPRAFTGSLGLHL